LERELGQIGKHMAVAAFVSASVAAVAPVFACELVAVVAAWIAWAAWVAWVAWAAWVAWIAWAAWVAWVAWVAWIAWVALAVVVAWAALAAAAVAWPWAAASAAAFAAAVASSCCFWDHPCILLALPSVAQPWKDPWHCSWFRSSKGRPSFHSCLAFEAWFHPLAYPCLACPRQGRVLRGC